MKVLAAMSGGVDSAVAAARAADAGHDVVGVHMALARNPATGRTGARGCCTIEDAGDARRAADVIGIPFYVWDLAEQFTEAVVDDFVEQYAAGRTPNPCVRCNERIKFAALLDKAVALGFDAVATGHYARVEPGDPPRLLRAADAAKDQSYVLAVAAAAAAGPVAVPARHGCLEGRGAGRGGPTRPVGVGQARQPRHLLHPRRRHPRLPRRPHPAAARRRRSTATAAPSAPTTAPRGTRWVSVAGCGWATPQATAVPGTCSRCRSPTTRSPSARPRRSRSGR